MLCVVCGGLDICMLRLLFSSLHAMNAVCVYVSGKMLKPAVLLAVRRRKKFKWENWTKWDEQKILPLLCFVSSTIYRINFCLWFACFPKKLSNKIWKITLSSASAPLNIIIWNTFSSREREDSCITTNMCKWNKKQRKISSLLLAIRQAYSWRLSFETFYALAPLPQHPKPFLAPLAFKQQQFRDFFPIFMVNDRK